MTGNVFYQCNGFPLQPGAYTLTVTATCANGVFASATQTVFIEPFTQLDIRSSNTAPCNDSIGQNICEKVCPNTTVTYSVNPNTPIGGTFGLYWEVQGAGSYTINNPPLNNSVTVVWGESGSGLVRLLVDGQSQCFSSNQVCVNIVPEPQAQFTTSPPLTASGLTVCEGQTLTFTNTSLAADYYEWFFSDDASTTTAVNPIHTYNTAGNYTVRLIARSACLCADTLIVPVTVIDALAPSLDCVGTVCPGEAVTYTASNACPPFVWTVSPEGTIIGGGLSNSDTIRVLWNQGPAGAISLSAQACSGNVCPQAAVFSVPVIDNNAEITGKARVCPGTREVYTIEAYQGVNFIWNLSGGGNIVEGQGTYRVVVEWSDIPTPGVTHWLTVAYDNCYLGCGGQDSLGVQVLSPFNLNGPVELCEYATGNFAARLTYNGTPILCNWRMLDTASTIIWNSASAIANVTPDATNAAGLFRILATPANLNQTCTDEAEWAVTMLETPSKPAGIAGINSICPGTPYAYSAFGAPPGASFRWTVQNGATQSTGAGNPYNVVWGNNAPRWIAVQQISTDGLGCRSDTVRLDITPIGTFNISGTPQLCKGEKATYSIPDPGAATVNWQITPAGAGAIVDGQGSGTVEVFWTTAGGHALTATICSQNAVFPITVLDLPEPIVVHPAGVCPGDQQPVGTTAGFADYSWLSASGVLLSNLSAPALGLGEYIISVTDANGCKGNSSFKIESYPLPNVTLTTAQPTGFCNNSVVVGMTALVNTDGDFSFAWTQNGTPVGANAPTFASNQYGVFRVLVTNQFGCSTLSNGLTLVSDCTGGGGGAPGGGDPPCPAGEVSIQIDPTLRCDSIQFQLLGGPNYIAGSTNWIFGLSGGAVLGVANSSDNAHFVFPNAGKYLVLARVQLAGFGTCQVIDSVDIIAKAQFEPAVECAGTATLFKEVSTFLPAYSITNWQWNFGDPGSGAANTSTTPNPGHIFANGNFTYPVVLTVTASTGCTSTATVNVAVPGGSAYTLLPPTVRCAGNATEFNAAATLDILETDWDFGDPGDPAIFTGNSIPVYHKYNTPGNYNISAVSINAYGCSATASIPVTILPNPLNGTITPASPPAICEGQTLGLNAPGGAAIGWEWSSGATTQTLVVGVEGVYEVTLTDANGCTFVPPAVRVEVTPSPEALIKALLTNALDQVVGVSYPTLTACYGETVTLQAEGAGFYSYSWSGGNGNLSTVTFSEERGNLLLPGSYSYVVTVTDFSTGCTAVTAPFGVTVNPIPSGFNINTSSSCFSSNPTLTYVGPVNANWQYLWSNNEAGTSTVAEYPGLYTINVTNEYGCSAISDPLTILPGPPEASIPAGCHTRCNPDTICLPILPNVVSWQWFFNGAPVAGATGPEFVAQQSGTYYAEMTDANGCIGQSDPLSLDLYTGVGNLNGQVWVDVNKNDIIDAADTLISGIGVLLNQNGTAVGSTFSAANGGYTFVSIPALQYQLNIDPATLPAGWVVISGNQNVTLNGCDDVEQNDFLVRFQCIASTANVQLSACAGSSATYNGTAIAAGTTQQFTFTTAAGCDSIIVVNVQTLQPTASSVQLSACPGSSAMYNGTAIAAGSTQQFILMNVAGCDSVVTVSVQTLQPTASSVQLSACPGSSAMYNGTAIAAGSTQQFTLINVAGCDSVVTVSVQILQPTASSVQLSACPGSSAMYNGTAIAAGSTQQFTLTNVAGCDSVVTVSVQTLQPTASSVQLSACAGSSAVYNGTSIPAGSTQQFTLTNAAGCDSLVTVSVQTAQPSSVSVQLTACPGSTATYNGVAIPVGALIQFTLPNAAGCDSVVTVSVQALTTSSSTLSVSVCPGEQYPYAGSSVAIGESKVFTLTAANGCDSLVTVQVASYPSAVFQLSAKPTCPNSNTGSVTAIQAGGSIAPYLYSIDGQSFSADSVFTQLRTGALIITMEDGNGCRFTESITVPALEPLSVVLPDGIISCDSSSVTLQAIVQGDTTGLKYLWSDGSTAPFLSTGNIGAVTLAVQNICESKNVEAQVNWAEIPADQGYFYVPNVFKPNASELENAHFRAYAAGGLVVRTFKFEVFDRWGNLIHRATQPEQAWEGNYRQKKVDPSVLVWRLQAEIELCGRTMTIKREGDVTVVR